MTIHLFISQALICAALYTKVKQGGNTADQRMPYAELKDYVFFLSQIFRSEFIFPTTPLDENIQAALHGLERDRVLRTSHDGGSTSKNTYVELHPDERALGRDNFDFYNFLIWPFIEATWLGTVSLFMLTPRVGADGNSEHWFDFRGLQDKTQLLGKTLYHQGDLSYYEAVNKEALNHAFSHLEEAGIILVSRPKDSKVPPRVRLDSEWMPSRDASGVLEPEGKLWDLCERISQSRREGKNRRDGATVRTRVLRLVDVVGSNLFENAVLEVDGQTSASKRRRGIQTTSHL